MMGSGFADELLAATRTADIDLALMTRHTDTLFAMRATEVSVIPIFQTIVEIEPFLVFGLSAVNVLGKHTEEHKSNHRSIYQTQQPIQKVTADDDI